MDFQEKKYNFRTFCLAHVKQTVSTNSTLLELVKESSVQTPYVLWADSQLAGRGTRGRQWKNPRESLLFSVAIALQKDLHNYIGVPLTLGVKIVHFLRQNGVDASLKWPNDIVVNDRKLAGILVEAAKNAEGQHMLIIGVGLNLEQADFELQQYQACAVGDFIQCVWDDQMKNKWVEALVSHIIEAVEEVTNHGLRLTVSEWKNVAAYQNESIDLYQDGEIVSSAVLQGIDESGRLLVSTPDGVRAYLSGTISVRKK